MFNGLEGELSAVFDAKTLLDGLIGALAGGVVAAIISARAERRNRRIEVAVNILERYMSEFQEIGEVKGLLANPGSLADSSALNRVIRIGDWYEIIAGFSQTKIVERSLLEKMGLKGEMKAFLDLVRAASPKAPLLGGAANQWDYLNRYAK